ncbi:MAG: hypothetical protein AB1439_02500 [candidate division FCPU426 bacterium]
MPENEINGCPGSVTYREGRKRLYLIWWVVGVLVQVLACLPVAWKRIRWRALLWTSLGFLGLMFAVESLALYWGWWVWNEQLLWGVKVGVVPLEEFLLYFLVVPSVITLQALIQALFCPRPASPPQPGA